MDGVELAPNVLDLLLDLLNHGNVVQIVSIKYCGLFDIPYLMLIAPMHPQSRVRVRWDTYILLILCTVCIITPYLICFDVQFGRLTAFGVNRCLMLMHCKQGENCKRL